MFEELIKNKALIEVDLNPAYDVFSVGVCLKSDDGIIISINLDCDEQKLDGFSVFRSNDISRYREADEYSYNIEDLQKFSSLLNLSRCNNFTDTLVHASEFGLIAFFEKGDLDEYYVATMNSISNNICSFNLVDQEGNDIGIKTIKLEDIVYFSFYTKYELELSK